MREGREREREGGRERGEGKRGRESTKERGEGGREGERERERVGERISA